MKFTMAELEKFQDKLMGANSAEQILTFVTEQGYEISSEEAASLYDILKNEQDKEGKLEDDLLRTVSGGIEVNNVPQYDVIKDYYKEKGANLAFILCIYYIPSPTCYDIIKLIEEEIENEK